MTVMVVAEVGVNHNSYMASAIALIDVAKEAGANTVKFQRRSPELSVPPAERDKPRVTPWGTTETYFSYRLKMEFSQEQYREIDQYCKSIGIKWTASVWDIPSLDSMREFDVPFLKIPSAHLVNDELLEACANSGSPVVLSCGMSTDAEVDRAVDIISGHIGASLMHCNSAYPSADNEQNLSMIDAMRWKYGLPIGFSSHSKTPYVPLAAVSRYNAVAVEAHITLDRAAVGSDHSASLEPAGLELLVREIRRLDTLRGDGKRKVYESELASLKKLRGV